jgi:hypothetical protein
LRGRITCRHDARRGIITDRIQRKTLDRERTSQHQPVILAESCELFTRIAALDALNDGFVNRL